MMNIVSQETNPVISSKVSNEFGLERNGTLIFSFNRFLARISTRTIIVLHYYCVAASSCTREAR